MASSPGWTAVFYHPPAAANVLFSPCATVSPAARESRTARPSFDSCNLSTRDTTLSFGEPPMPISVRLRVATCALAAAMALSLPARALVIGAYRILPLPDYFEKTGHKPPGGGDGPLYYYGGSVFSN